MPMLSTLRHDAGGRIANYAKELGAWTSWASFADGFCLVRSLGKLLGIQPGELNAKLAQSIVDNSEEMQAWAEESTKLYWIGVYDRVGGLWNGRDGHAVQSWENWREEYLGLLTRYRECGMDDEWAKEASRKRVKFDNKAFFRVSPSSISRLNTTLIESLNEMNRCKMALGASARLSYGVGTPSWQFCAI